MWTLSKEGPENSPPKHGVTVTNDVRILEPLLDGDINPGGITLLRSEKKTIQLTEAWVPSPKSEARCPESKVWVQNMRPKSQIRHIKLRLSQ